MRNKMRGLQGDTPDVEKLIKETRNGILKVFGGYDLTEMAGKILPGWKVDFQKITLCERRRDEKLLTDEDVSEFIAILNTAKKILHDPEAPEENKAMLVQMYFRQVLAYAMHIEGYHAEKLFARRAEIEKGNVLRDLFIFNYIDNEVYPRFFEARDKAREEEFKAQGIDPDKYYEEYEERITEEELKRDNQEWEERTNQLFREYDESDLIGSDPLQTIKEWQKKLPEELKKALAEDEKRLEAQVEQEIEILEGGNGESTP